MSNLIKFFRFFDFKRLVKNIKYLIKYDLNEKELDIIFKAKDGAIDDCVYELEEDKKLLSNLTILDDEQTLSMLSHSKKSFARFGDGEIAIIRGINCNFQKYEPKLAEKLLSILEKKREDLFVGLNRSYFHSSFPYSDNNHRFYRLYGTDYRRFFLKVCDPSNIYLDACCFGGYFRLKSDTDFEVLYERNKSLFRGEKIAIVAGEGLLNNLQHDVFEYAVDRIIIPSPSKNAFDNYDQIIQEIKEKVPKDYIVCLILGQTATVMAADLTDLGYVAWDIGHLPKDYNAYKNKTLRTKEEMDNYWKADL